jgi:hypothetical protein
MIKNNSNKIIIITLILLCITLIAISYNIEYLYKTVLGRLLLFLFIICITIIDKTFGIIISAFILTYYNEYNLEGFVNNSKIDSIELFEGSINNMDDLKNINGIGEKINAKIKELIETGKMMAVENALNDPQFSLQKKLGKLYGVGPVKINELMKNINSFEELYEHPELLNEKQKIGLKYYNDMNLRIPMSEGKKTL